MARAKTTKKSDTTKTNKQDNISDNIPNAPEGKDSGENRESSASRRNRNKLAEDENTYISMPEMSDIPGQENITSAGVPGAMGDTTASSDDEEGVVGGKDILAEEDEELEIVMGTDADVTEDDLALLGDPDQDMDLGEDELVRTEGLDDRDTEGDPLNESSIDMDTTGEDLDVPEGNERYPRRDAMDQGDEENDYYSLGGDRSDANDDGTPEEYRERGE